MSDLESNHPLENVKGTNPKPLSSENESDFESEIEERTSQTSNRGITNSLDKRLEHISQASSTNRYDSDLFEDTDDDNEHVNPNADLDLQSMFGAKKIESVFNHDVNTAEGVFKIKIYFQFKTKIRQNYFFFKLEK